MEPRQIMMDGDTWERVRLASLKEGARTGRAVSMSEWIRTAVHHRLNRMKVSLPTVATKDQKED